MFEPKSAVFHLVSLVSQSLWAALSCFSNLDRMAQMFR